MNITPDLMNDVLKLVIEQLVPILFAALLVMLRKPIQDGYRLILTKISEAELMETVELVRLGARKAEQFAYVKNLKKAGELKFQVAMDFIQTALDKRGKKYDIRELAGMLEAVVHDEFTQFKVDEYLTGDIPVVPTEPFPNPYPDATPGLLPAAS